MDDVSKIEVMMSSLLIKKMVDLNLPTPLSNKEYVNFIKTLYIKNGYDVNREGYITAQGKYIKQIYDLYNKAKGYFRTTMHKVSVDKYRITETILMKDMSTRDYSSFHSQIDQIKAKKIYIASHTDITYPEYLQAIAASIVTGFKIKGNNLSKLVWMYNNNHYPKNINPKKMTSFKFNIIETFYGLRFNDYSGYLSVFEKYIIISKQKYSEPVSRETPISNKTEIITSVKKGFRTYNIQTPDIAISSDLAYQKKIMIEYKKILEDLDSIEKEARQKKLQYSIDGIYAKPKHIKEEEKIILNQDYSNMPALEHSIEFLEILRNRKIKEKEREKEEIKRKKEQEEQQALKAKKLKKLEEQKIRKEERENSIKMADLRTKQYILEMKINEKFPKLNHTKFLSQTIQDIDDEVDELPKEHAPVMIDIRKERAIKEKTAISYKNKILIDCREAWTEKDAEGFLNPISYNLYKGHLSKEDKVKYLNKIKEINDPDCIEFLKSKDL